MRSRSGGARRIGQAAGRNSRRPVRRRHTAARGGREFAGEPPRAPLPGRHQVRRLEHLCHEPVAAFAPARSAPGERPVGFRGVGVW
jgi:hypothetical protein